MMAASQIVALAGFASLMIAAAFEDLRRLIIPNPLVLALCLMWPLYLIGNPSLYIALASLGCAALVFVVGALCFSRGWLGGGDVKLLAAAALWCGPTYTPTLLLLTGMLGGVLALFLMLPPGAYIATLARTRFGSLDVPAGDGLATPVPYGIAIASAAVIVIFVPHL
ncbi:MAG: prepilin peptidase [Alphaproteobacteria bacterium]|nr:prepilin peptidase [Alphaproteobacteria bacterium]